jgi:hypothetical protein
MHSEDSHILCHSWIFFKFLKKQTSLEIKKLKKKEPKRTELSLSWSIAREKERFGFNWSLVKYEQICLKGEKDEEPLNKLLGFYKEEETLFLIFIFFNKCGVRFFSLRKIVRIEH